MTTLSNISRTKKKSDITVFIEKMALQYTLPHTHPHMHPNNKRQGHNERERESEFKVLMKTEFKY